MGQIRLVFYSWIFLTTAVSSTWAAGPPDAATLAYSLLGNDYPRAERNATPPKTVAVVDKELAEYSCEYLTQLVAFLREQKDRSLTGVNSRKTYPSGINVVKVISSSSFDEVISDDEKGRFTKINRSKDYAKWLTTGILDIPANHKVDFYGYDRASKVVKESYQKIIVRAIEQCEKEKVASKKALGSP